MGNFLLLGGVIEDLERRGIISSILKLSISLFDNPKMIKTSLGCLANICMNESARESMSKDKNLLIILYNVLEKYDYSGSIIEYCLKLLYNTLSNGNSIKFNKTYLKGF